MAVSATKQRVNARVGSWVLWGLPVRARLLVFAVNGAFIAVLALGFVSTPLRVPDLVLFAVLVGCGLLSLEASLRLVWRGPRAGRATNDLLAVWTIPVVLLLPPLYAAVAVVPLNIFSHVRVAKRPLVKLLYSVAAAGAANFLAAAFHQTLVAHPHGWQMHSVVGAPGAVTATVACVLLRHAINMGLVAEIVALTTPARRAREAFADREIWAVISAESCTGILVALVAAAVPFAVLFAVPPVLVLQRTLLLAEYREAARTDPKTGVANSSYWREVAEREIARARSGRDQIAVLLVDVDHFKNVNDRYGHLTGDEVLRKVADGLTHGLRPHDFVGRFGGEEFVVLLTGSDLEQARHAAERIRAHVAELRIEASNRRDPVQVTISIGVAAFRESGHTVHELLDAADTALYAAKNAGRDCVRVAEGARQQVLDLTADTPRVLDLRPHRSPVE